MFLVAVLFLTTFAASSVSAQMRGRRYVRMRSPSTQTARPTQKTDESVSIKSTMKLSPEEARKQLDELCTSLKDDFKPMTPEEVERSKQHLRETVGNLIRLMRSDRDRESAAVWMERFQLEDLQKTLRDEEGPDKVILANTWKALHSDQKGIRWHVFDGLRNSLRRYFRFEALVRPVGEKTAYDSEFVRICDSLPALIDAYSKNVIERQDNELSNTMDWLEDVSCVEPRAAKLAELARSAFSGVNLRVRVGAAFIGAGFQTEIEEEELEISESILGTRVTGSGTMSAESTGGPVEAKNRAEILVKVAAKMDSVTTGHQSPVTLNTKTTGTLYGEKRIVIAEDRITATPARTKADLQSSIYNVRVSAGPLVQGIARNQVQERQGASKAESRRRAEQRMNKRMDERIDPRIHDLDVRYREKLREPLKKAGLFPRVWDLSSSEDAIHWDTLIAADSQPSAMNAAPEVDREFGVLVRIHQSALNNAAAIGLAGKYFDEDEIIRQLKEQFEKLPAALDRPENEDPLRLTFAPEGPIRVSFNDDKIQVLVQIHEFFLPRPGDSESGSLQARRGLNINLTYDIKTEKVKGEDGVTREVVVLEQTEEPKLSPRPGDGKQFSALSNPTQTVVKRRLKAMEKRIVGKPRELEGEWEGKGLLVPSYASAKDGWLTFGWDWIPNGDQ